MNEHIGSEARQGQYLIWVLLLIPVLVVLAATFVFFTGIGMPKDTRNKGILISPPQQINDIQLLDKNGKPFIFDREKDAKWTLLTAHSAYCADDCKQRFWMSRQTRSALGQYRERVRRVWLVTEGKLDSDTEQWLQKEHSDIVVLQGNEKKWQQLLMRSNYSSIDESQANFYLVDLQGFVMMYYTMQNTYKDIMADMKFLLKESE